LENLFKRILLVSVLINEEAARSEVVEAMIPDSQAALSLRNLIFKSVSKAEALAIETREIAAPLTKVFMRA